MPGSTSTCKTRVTSDGGQSEGRRWGRRAVSLAWLDELRACRSCAPDSWPARLSAQRGHGCRGRPSPEQTLCTTSTSAANHDSRIGSLFSGYGLARDLAVEHVFNATTVWFSELNTRPSPASSRTTGPKLESWRHHGHRLESGRARGHPHRRIPVPRRFHGRQARRPCSGYALGSLGAHGRSHRRAPARMGRHRERPRAAVLTRDAAIRRRR